MNGRHLAMLFSVVLLAGAAPSLLSAQQAEMSLSNPKVFVHMSRDRCASRTSTTWPSTGATAWSVTTGS